MRRPPIRRSTKRTVAGGPRLRTVKKQREWSFLVVCILSFCICVQCVAAALWSPLCRVTPESVQINVSPQYTREEVLALIERDLPISIARVPINRWRKAIGAIPFVKDVKIKLIPPKTVDIHLMDRNGYAKVQGSQGGLVVVDSGFVPFSLAQHEDKTFPVVKLLQYGDLSTFEPGRRLLSESRLQVVSTIREWLNRNTAITDSIIIMRNDNTRIVLSHSGTDVLLGSSRRLSEKLATLGILIANDPEIVKSSKYLKINLYSDEFPALVKRTDAVNNVNL